MRSVLSAGGQCYVNADTQATAITSAAASKKTPRSRSQGGFRQTSTAAPILEGCWFPRLPSPCLWDYSVSVSALRFTVN